MRNIALSQIKKIMAGSGDLEEIKAFCQCSQIVLQSLKVEIDYLKAIRRDQTIAFIPDTHLIENKHQN